ncbi:hypothetical protein OG369_25265 [Streptomyces sp. NBC_01221]|nr:hypothetical protein [Streptomyces sp. NBC_01221]MCX4789370.1 hypothetical protein [Streptomyces sp. NBC_01221]
MTAEEAGAGPDAVRLVDQEAVLGGVGGEQNASPGCRAVHGTTTSVREG